MHTRCAQMVWRRARSLRVTVSRRQQHAIIDNYNICNIEFVSDRCIIGIVFFDLICHRRRHNDVQEALSARQARG
jgi:hypothetical protein